MTGAEQLEQPAANGDGSAPQTLGAYEVIGELASGGMGRVLLGRRAGHGGFERLFAIKVLHEDMLDEPEALSMLLDEARIASRLHHPNVVPIVDVGSIGDDEGFYLVLEYVEGPSFYHLLRAYPNSHPPQVIVPIVLDALRGLHSAHELTEPDGSSANLVHRDFTPHNLLVSLDGACRVTDFGIAKVEARLTHTRAGIHKGRLAYMAPEQMTAARDIDRRADVWSAGVSLWYALTGKHPFRGESEAETVTNILREDVPPPSAVGMKPPSCFDAICLKALRRPREERYATVQEMADELHATAIAEGLLGKPSEVAVWVRSAFADNMAARREALRSIASGSWSGSGIILPKTRGGTGSALSLGSAPSQAGPTPTPEPMEPVAPSVEIVLGDLEEAAESSPDVSPPPPMPPGVAPDASPAPPGDAEDPDAKPTPPQGVAGLDALVAGAASDEASRSEEAPRHAVPAAPRGPAPSPAQGKRAVLTGPVLLVVGAAAIIAIVAGIVVGVVAATRGGDEPEPPPAEPTPTRAGVGGGAGLEAPPPTPPTPPSAPPPATAPARDAAPEAASSSAALEAPDAGERAANSFRVTLTGVPEGARIRLDGYRIEVTVFDVARGPNSHIIRVNASGYEPWSHTIPSMNEDDVTVPVELTPRSGRSGGRRVPSVVRNPGF